ncbi:MAG: hypothetical protein WC824_00735 [Bacteroidota bacterium]
MNRLLFLLVLTFSLGTQALGQEFDWEWMNPLPGGNALRGAVRLDSTNALLLGFMNEIFRTSDQGESWQKQFREIDDQALIQDVSAILGHYNIRQTEESYAYLASDRMHAQVNLICLVDIQITIE